MEPKWKGPLTRTSRAFDASHGGSNMAITAHTTPTVPGFRHLSLHFPWQCRSWTKKCGVQFWCQMVNRTFWSEGKLNWFLHLQQNLGSRSHFMWAQLSLLSLKDITSINFTPSILSKFQRKLSNPAIHQDTWNANGPWEPPGLGMLRHRHVDGAAKHHSHGHALLYQCPRTGA